MLKCVQGISHTRGSAIDGAAALLQIFTAVNSFSFGDHERNKGRTQAQEQPRITETIINFTFFLLLLFSSSGLGSLNKSDKEEEHSSVYWCSQDVNGQAPLRARR